MILKESGRQTAPGSRRARFLFGALLVFGLAGGIAIGAWLWLTGAEGGVTIALVILTATCIAPVAMRVIQRRLDPFEPIYAFLISTAVYFVLVPGVLLSQHNFSFLGFDYSGEAVQVTALALLATVGFSLGYYGREVSTARKASRPSQELGQHHRRLLHGVSLAMLAFFAILIVLWIRIAQIPLETLWIFGNASYNDAWDLATGPQIGYLYGAREAIPACLLLLLGLRSERRWSIVVLLLFVLTFGFFAGGGARFRVLLLVMSLGLFYFLERGTRPRTWQIMLAVLVIFYVIIGGVGFYRSATVEAGTLRGRSLAQDTLTLDDAWDVMLEGSQISVSTAVLLRAVPAYQPYFNGASFLNVFTQPVPRILWPDKPAAAGEDFFARLWPPGTTVPFWALFYLNFGPAAVAVGMAIWGWLSQLIYDVYRRNAGNPLAQVQLAVYWPFMIHMYGRGGDNFAFNVYGLIFVLVPVWFLFFIRRFLHRRKQPADAHKAGIRRVKRARALV